MLHKVTGATIAVALILLLLLKLEVLGGPFVSAGVALFVASCVLTVVSMLSRRSDRKQASAQPPRPATSSTPTQPPDGAPESPMQVACRYIRTGDALKAEGKIDEAIATYREGENVARRDPALGPNHAMTFLLHCAARDLERAAGKTKGRSKS